VKLGTRKRVIPAGISRKGVLDEHSTWFGDPVGVPNHSVAKLDFSSLDGIQITESENHPGWLQPYRHGVFRGDLGGNFSTIKKEMTGVIADQTLHGEETRFYPSGSTARYVGPVLPIAPGVMEFPPDNSYSLDKLEEMGATAIARCSPTKPTIDFTTAIGEFVQDGIPHLVGSGLKELRTMLPSQRRKALAGEYLNFQFGWRPFINDVTSIAARIVDGDAAYQQFLRDSGKLVRRRYDFPTKTEESTKIISYAGNPWYAPSTSTLDATPSQFGQVVRLEKITHKVWFSGAFTYLALPPTNGWRDTAAGAFIWLKKSWGLGLTPDAVWNLAPWSWAVDWFTNAGDVLENMDAWILDGQVLAYGYMMETCVTSWTYLYVGPTGLKGSPTPSPITLTTTSKKRVGANPYGFGLTWDGLTTFQKSIIAALGLNRGHGKH